MTRETIGELTGNVWMYLHYNEKKEQAFKDEVGKLMLKYQVQGINVWWAVEPDWNKLQING